MTDKTAQVIEWAREAKSYMQQANPEPPPDELIIRAAWSFDMLVRAKVIVEADDLDRPHSIATIASNFSTAADTPGRAAVFATKL